LREAVAESDTLQKGKREGVGPAIVAMSEMQMQSIFWLWPGMISSGKLTLIAGDPKLGKSSLALSLIATLTTGGEWRDGTRCCDAADALIATTEDDPADTVLPRLVEMGAASRASSKSGEMLAFAHIPTGTTTNRRIDQKGFEGRVTLRQEKSWKGEWNVT
jgi:hypothetical protein